MDNLAFTNSLSPDSAAQFTLDFESLPAVATLSPEPEPPVTNASQLAEEALPRLMPTLADALLAIDVSADLSPSTRVNLRSAVKRAGAIIGRDLGAISCDPLELSHLVYAQPPRASGLQPRNHANLLSRLRNVLRLVGTHGPRGRPGEPLPGPWAAVVESVPGVHQHAALTRFSRWAIAENLSPDQVERETILRYEAHRKATELMAPRQGVARTLCKLWRAAVEAGAIPGGHATRLPGRSNTYVLDDETFPASLIGEREAWLAAAGARSIGRSLIDPSAPRRPMSAATVKMRRFAFRQVASVLVMLGHPADSLREMRDLVVPIQRVADVIVWFEQRRDERVGGRVESTHNPSDAQLSIIIQTLIVIAKRAREVPPETIAGLSGLISDYQAGRGKGLTPKNEARLRAAIQPQAYAMLINLPEELMQQAREQMPTNQLAASRIAMHAVALEVLLICPMRRKNLAALRVDEHLQRLDPTRRGRVTHLVIPASQTKNKRRIEWPVPEQVSRLVEEYNRDFRPHLAQAGSVYLFPSRCGAGHAEEASLGMAIAKDVARNVGIQINLHLLRHFAAWLYLRKHPGRMDDVRRVLGHHSIDTTERFYVAFQDVAAAERFDEVVLGERRRTAATAAAAWRSPLAALKRRRGRAT